VRVYLYGDGFASIDGALSMSAFGPGASIFRGHQGKLNKLRLPGCSPHIWQACARRALLEGAPAAALQRNRNDEMKFGEPNDVGGIHKGGRPRGARSRLFAQVFQDVLDHWNQPVEGRNISKGMAALEVMRKERPAEYVKAVLSIMPKELLLSDSTMADLNDEQVDTLLATLRKQVLEHAVELN
jgi:hypothetical protein